MDKRTREPEAMPDHYGTGRQLYRKRSLLSLTLLLLLLLVGTNLLTAAFLMGYRIGKTRQEPSRSPGEVTAQPSLELPKDGFLMPLRDCLAEIITSRGSQTGIVLSTSGYILTTAFEGSPLEIRVGEETYTQVTRRGFSPECGLAVLHISAENLRAIPIGFAGVLTAAEEGLIHIRQPLSSQPLMTRAEVAEQTELPLGGAERRMLLGDYEEGDLLLNDQGQLTAFCVETAEGVLALPMEEVINLVGELIAFGMLDAPGSPGIEIAQLDEAQSFYWDLPGNIMVSRIKEGSIAQQVGLLEGDILLTIGGREIGDPAAFWQSIAACATGGPVTVTVYRGAEELEFLLHTDK